MKPPYKLTLTKKGPKIERPEPIKVKIGGKTEIIEWSHPLYNTINYYGKK